MLGDLLYHSLHSSFETESFIESEAWLTERRFPGSFFLHPLTALDPQV